MPERRERREKGEPKTSSDNAAAMAIFCLFFFFLTIFSASGFLFWLEIAQLIKSLCRLSVCLSDWHFAFRIYAHKTSGKFDVDKGDNCHQLRCSGNDFSSVSFQFQFQFQFWQKTRLLIEFSWVELTRRNGLTLLTFLIAVDCCLSVCLTSSQLMSARYEARHKLDINMCLLPKSNQSLFYVYP